MIIHIGSFIVASVSVFILTGVILLASFERDSPHMRYIFSLLTMACAH